MTQAQKVVFAIVGAAAVVSVAFFVSRGPGTTVTGVSTTGTPANVSAPIGGGDTGPEQGGNSTNVGAVSTGRVRPSELGWKTYAYADGSVEFRYPETWVLGKVDDPKASRTVALSSPDYCPIMSGTVPLAEVYVTSYPNPQQLTVQQVFDGFDDGSWVLFKDYPYQTTRIGGRLAYVFDDTYGGSGHESKEYIVNCPRQVAAVQFNHTSDINSLVVDYLASTLACR